MYSYEASLSEPLIKVVHLSNAQYNNNNNNNMWIYKAHNVSKQAQSEAPYFWLAQNAIYNAL